MPVRPELLLPDPWWSSPVTLEAPSRTTRRRPLDGAHVVTREFVALEFVSRAQPITTRQYARLLGVAAPIARRSLRKLRDLGQVTPWVLALHAETLFTLAPAGAKELARVRGREVSEFKVPRGIGHLQLRHHGMSVELAVALTVATARSSTWALSQYLWEQEIRAALGNPKDALIPDAVAVLERSDGLRFALAAELDTGSERNPSWMGRKFADYQRLHGAGKPIRGCSEWAVCVVVPDVRRLHKLAGASLDVGVGEGLLYFAIADQVDDRNVLRDVWQTTQATDHGTARLMAASPLPATSAWYNREIRQAATTPQEHEGSGALPEGYFTSSGVSS